jgi:hypothetical protein
LHASLARIFQSLKPGMETPELVLCADGHYRRAMWSFAAYIADYPEQVDLAGVNTGWCARQEHNLNDELVAHALP